MPWSVSVPAMALQVLRHRGSVARAFDAATRELARRPVEEIVSSLRAHANDATHAPRMPAAPLIDTIVHGDDLRQPLGIVHDVPGASIRRALDQLVVFRDLGAFLPRSRVKGLRLVATDLDWSWGDGAEVSGPARAVLSGVLGRRDAVAELGGEGATLLASRLGS
jgi:uncharacterized protein (TIGR03083 family)